MIKVMNVEHHWVWAIAVRSQLATADGIEWVGEAATVDDALRLVGTAGADVALVDVALVGESGIRFARVARARFPRLHVVMTAVEPTAWTIADARAAGVAGFVGKSDLLTGDTLVELVREVAAGGQVFSRSALAEESGSGAHGCHAVAPRFGLTVRERELIALLGEGCGNVEIARRMCVGVQTVKNSTRAVGAKLGVSGRLEIVVEALAEGLISSPRARTR